MMTDKSETWEVSWQHNRGKDWIPQAQNGSEASSRALFQHRGEMHPDVVRNVKLSRLTIYSEEIAIIPDELQGTKPPTGAE